MSASEDWQQSITQRVSRALAVARTNVPVVANPETRDLAMLILLAEISYRLDELSNHLRNHER